VQWSEVPVGPRTYSSQGCVQLRRTRQCLPSEFLRINLGTVLRLSEGLGRSGLHGIIISSPNEGLHFIGCTPGRVIFCGRKKFATCCRIVGFLAGIGAGAVTSCGIPTNWSSAMLGVSKREEQNGLHWLFTSNRNSLIISSCSLGGETLLEVQNGGRR
jgi:hypothetical protein